MKPESARLGLQIGARPQVFVQPAVGRMELDPRFMGEARAAPACPKQISVDYIALMNGDLRRAMLR